MGYSAPLITDTVCPRPPRVTQGRPSFCIPRRFYAGGPGLHLQRAFMGIGASHYQVRGMLAYNSEHVLTELGACPYWTCGMSLLDL